MPSRRWSGRRASGPSSPTDGAAGFGWHGVAGASFGGAKGRDRVPELVDTYMSGDLDLESLVTRRVALDDVNDAFAAMERQEGIRTVITY